MENQNIAPILVLVAIAAAILYLHFTNGRGLTRIYLTALLVAVSLFLVAPSLYLPVPSWWRR